MKISEIVEPTPEIINEVKKSYNRLLTRQQNAGKYLDDINIPNEEKENHILTFRIEILDTLNSYLEVLKEWGEIVTDEEILRGMHIR